MKLMDILRYKLLRIEHYLRMNLGKDKYGYQVFALQVENMILNGYRQIFDAGSLVYSRTL